jgi:RNA polymerase sigma factor (TIGR02999 family)
VGAGGRDWGGLGHFFAAAAEAMRRILVEQARRKQRIRHGGGRRRLSLDQLDLADEQAANDVLDLDEALTRLAAEDATVAAVVRLRYFTGLTGEEAAKALGLRCAPSIGTGLTRAPGCISNSANRPPNNISEQLC